MTDDPRVLAEKVLRGHQFGTVYSVIAAELARALLDALDERDGERVAKLTVQAELRAALDRAEAAERERDRLREERDNWHASAVKDRQRAEEAERERDEMRGMGGMVPRVLMQAEAERDVWKARAEAAERERDEAKYQRDNLDRIARTHASLNKKNIARAEAAERQKEAAIEFGADQEFEKLQAEAERDRYREALEYVASDPRLPNRLKRIITDALSPARSSKAKSQLCECGHHRSTHPYVGRHASWPTRCVYCDCTQFRSSTADEKP